MNSVQQHVTQELEDILKGVAYTVFPEVKKRLTVSKKDSINFYLELEHMEQVVQELCESMTILGTIYTDLFELDVDKVNQLIDRVNKELNEKILNTNKEARND